MTIRLSAELAKAIADYRRVKADLDAFDGDRRGIAAALAEAESKVIAALELCDGDEEATADWELIHIAVKAIDAKLAADDEATVTGQTADGFANAEVYTDSDSLFAPQRPRLPGTAIPCWTTDHMTAVPALTVHLLPAWGLAKVETFADGQGHWVSREIVIGTLPVLLHDWWLWPEKALKDWFGAKPPQPIGRFAGDSSSPPLGGKTAASLDELGL